MTEQPKRNKPVCAYCKDKLYVIIHDIPVCKDHYEMNYRGTRF